MKFLKIEKKSEVMRFCKADSLNYRQGALAEKNGSRQASFFMEQKNKVNVLYSMDASSIFETGTGDFRLHCCRFLCFFQSPSFDFCELAEFRYNIKCCCQRTEILPSAADCKFSRTDKGRSMNCDKNQQNQAVSGLVRHHPAAVYFSF